jgi:hypothetical protein|tara:strand:- start:1197 stop:1406 length:210 start_codon:yes stop_codon:yes gene_type:complete
MLKLFTKHPHSSGESYLAHMKTAFKYSISLAGLSVVAFIHGIFPFIFETTTSSKIKKMSEEIGKSRWSR